MPSRIPAIICMALLLLAFGCGSDSTDPVGGGNDQTDDYLKALPEWDEFCPPGDDGIVATDPSTDCLDVVDNQRYFCVETPKSITDTPEDVVTFGGGGGILWPGALIQGSTYVGGVGTMEELPIRQRAPLTLSISLLTEDNSVTVQNPDYHTVNSALGGLIDGAEGVPAGRSVFFQMTEAYTMDQLALGLSLRASYLGASVRSQLDYEKSTETHTLAAYFKEKVFTVNMAPLQSPDEVFSDAFTPELLQQQVDAGRIGPKNLPVYVSEVVYGRVLVMTMTSTRSVSEMRAALQASYAAVRAGVELEDTSVFEESVITVASIGGSTTADIGELVTTGSLASFFSEETVLAESVPIAYTLCNLADNTRADVSETTSYVERVCSAVEITYHDLESAWRNTVLGEEGDDIHTFVPNATNLALSQEIASPPSSNNGLGSTLTFLGADTQFPFDFVISKATPGAFVYNDQESGNAYDGCSYPHIAPGDADNWEDDDFEVTVTRVDEGLCLSGIAVNVGHNGTGPEEYLEVYGPSGVLLEQFTGGLPSSTGYTFMGVASPLPLRGIFFNEDAGGDDMCFQNIWFSVRLEGGGSEL